MLHDPTERAIWSDLAGSHPPDRLDHVRGVRQTALALAARFAPELSLRDVSCASLVHDIVKFESRERLLRLVRGSSILVDIIEVSQPALLHAPAAAALARQAYGLDDRDLLAAVRYHALGRAGMSPFEQVLFLADKIEPTRSYPGVEAIRRLAWDAGPASGLRAFFWRLFEHLRSQGIEPHWRTRAAAHWLGLAEAEGAPDPLSPA